MSWQTVTVHVSIAVVAIAAVVALAIHGTIPGSDAFAVIMSVLVGAGVIAGVSSQSPPAPSTTTATSTPTSTTVSVVPPAA